MARTPRSQTPRPVKRTLDILADHLSTWRKLQGLTQAQVADRAGISQQTVAKLERGDGGVSTENLARVLRALGVLDSLEGALDPYETDLGRARSDQILPERVRQRRQAG